MKYVDEFRNQKLSRLLSEQIHAIVKKEIRLMEVCGGHTLSIHRFGIPELLPPSVHLLSGPGCPVCVSDIRFIDHAIALARLDNVIITTFGDLIRVPGSTSSLEKEKSSGADVRVIYSSLDAIEIANQNPGKKVVFLGIGFETTAPSTAVAVMTAAQEHLTNYFVLSAHKVMPPVMEALIDEGILIDGYIAPGHVSTITGSAMYRFIPEKYKLAVVISGFEPLDLMQSIYMLVRQIEEGRPAVEIQYRRAVRPEGNPKAKTLMNEIFELRDDWWRGFGIIPASGLALRKKYRQYDASVMLPVSVEPPIEPKGCLCGLVLKGLKKPVECKLYKTACTPDHPVGACMVSGEGACATYYRYGKE